MIWIIVVLFIIVAIIAIFNGSKKQPTQKRIENNTPTSKGYSFDPYSDENFKMGVYKTIIKGISHRGLTKDDLGIFFGYASAQTDNEYDEYAVAIYNHNDKHLGFAPRNYMTLHQSILDRYYTPI